MFKAAATRVGSCNEGCGYRYALRLQRAMGHVQWCKFAGAPQQSHSTELRHHVERLMAGAMIVRVPQDVCQRIQSGGFTV